MYVFVFYLSIPRYQNNAIGEVEREKEISEDNHRRQENGRCKVKVRVNW
jgi:hypothetical protein